MSAIATELFGVASSALSNLLSVTVIPQGMFQPSSGDAIPIQATLEETGTDLVTITDHPVEAGAEISDHSFVRPAELTMRCGWSNSSQSSFLGAATSLFSGGGLSQFAGLSNLTGGAGGSPTLGGMSVSDYVSGIYSQLLALQQSLQPFTVVTSIRQYTNMMMTSLAVTRDQKTSQALMVTATMRQVILVSTSTTTLAPIQNQADPASTAEDTQQGPQQPTANATPSPDGSVSPDDMAPGQIGGGG